MHRLHDRYKKVIECMDPDELIDVLEVTTEELVERLSDIIEERLPRLEYLLGDLDTEDDDDEDTV